MKKALRLAAAGLSLAFIAGAQTLQDAEALWKARRFQDANNVFRILVANHPDNLDYKVRWGRMFLDHAQPEDAADLFNEVLKIKKDHAGALVGLALIAADSFEHRAADLATKALEANPKELEAQELLARLALEDNDNAKATEEAKKALAIDANSVQGKAILATMDWLADKKDTPWDPHAARGYETAGHFFVLNRRYQEGIEFYKKALGLDPQLYSARSQMGVNMMRLGDNEGAYKELETCYNNDFQDAATRNSLKLLDTLKKFVVFKTDNTILKMDPKEAELLRPYFESEMKRAIATYEKKYRMKLEHPVMVEVYPNHDDFAVRTLGMPGLGALGVTFGYSIAMDSPSGRKPGSFHWASTLWHEMSHVFTLTATNHKVPRWFTEGMAVHEETAASPEWGDRLGPDVLMAIKEKQLLPVAELDRGFVHPKAAAQVLVSYYQAGRICDYINDKWGWDTLLGMLHDFGEGMDTPSVIRKELKIEPEAFDKQFFATVEAENKKTIDGFEEWKKTLKLISEAAREKDWDKVIARGTEIRDLYPDYVEAGSVYEFLANAYIAKGNKPAAMAELDRYMKTGGREPEPIKQYARLLEEAGRKKDAAAALDRLNLIYPIDNDLHQRLGAIWLEEGNAAGAVREFNALVSHKPIDPAQAHFELARAYRMAHQMDKATDEVLAALETAPGYKPAQKLLLELNSEGSGTPAPPIKK